MLLQKKYLLLVVVLCMFGFRGLGQTVIHLTSSPVAAADVCPGATDVTIYSFNLDGAGAGGNNLTGLTFTQSGTAAVPSDIVQYKLWQNSVGGTLVATSTTPVFAFAAIAFDEPDNFDFFITADIAGSPTDGNVIIVDAMTAVNLTVSGTATNGATSAGGTQTISAPAVSVSGGGTFCGNTVISALGGPTIFFQGTTSGGTSTILGTTPQNITTSGTYYFRSRSPLTGCWGAEGSAVVVINPLPATVVVSGGGAFCGSTSITAANGGSGTIFFQGTTSGGTSTVLGGSPQTISTSGTYFFRAQSGSGCWGVQGSAVVTINPIPTLTTLPIDICSGTNLGLSLSASTPSTFTWTIGSIAGLITGASAGSGSPINQTLTNPSSSLAGSVDYVITPTSIAGSCVGTTATITIGVNPAPSLTTPTTATICGSASTSIPLTATATSNFSWTIGAITGTISGQVPGSGATISQILTNSGSTTGSVPYNVTPTSFPEGCIGLPTTITVAVNPTPTLISATTYNICSGSSPGATLVGSVPSNFIWTIGSVTGGITGANACSSSCGATIPDILSNPISTLGSVEYIVTPTAPLGACTGVSTTVTVNVSPIPSITTATSATTCSNTSPNVILSATTPSNFSWTIGSVFGSITGAVVSSGSAINQNLVNPSSSASGSVEYIVTPTSIAGSCVGSPTSINITVDPAPVLTSATSSNICSGTSSGISLTSSIPSNFTWTLGPNIGSITGASPCASSCGSAISNILTNPSNSSIGTVSYIITPTSTSGICIGLPTAITVSVNPTPIITTAVTANTCSGVSPNITLSSSTASTFSWTIGSIVGSVSGQSASSGPIINQVLTSTSSSTTGSVEYIVTPTSSIGSCTGIPATITVFVNPSPAITTSPTYSICSGVPTNIGLIATTASNFAWTVPSFGTISGTSPGSGTSFIVQTLNNPSSSTPDNVVYNVVPTSTLGCVGIPFNIVVTVHPKPQVLTLPAASICSDVRLSIPHTVSVSSDFSWTLGPISGGITGANICPSSCPTMTDSLHNPSNTTSGTVVYRVIPTSIIGGCVGDITNITITVDPKPVITTSLIDSTCNNTSPNLALTASTTSSFAWTIGTIIGGVTGASNSSGPIINQTLVNPSDSTIASVVYMVTPTSSASCIGNPSSINVIVKPTPHLISSNNISICSETRLNYTAVASTRNITISDFAWTTVASSGITFTNRTDTIPNISDSISSNYLLTTDSIEYKFTITSLGCTETNGKLTVLIKPRPKAPIMDVHPSSQLCLSVLCQNFGVDRPAFPNELFEWRSTNSAMFQLSSPKQFVLVSFPNEGIDSIIFTTHMTGFDCYATVPFVDTIAQFENKNKISNNPYVYYYNGRFICEDTALNGSASYQWGYDRKNSLDSGLINNEINQHYYSPDPNLPPFDTINNYIWVMTTRKNGCTQKSYCNPPPLFINTDVKPVNASIKTYPNPTHNNLTIELVGNNNKRDAIVEVFDLIGKKMISSIISNNEGIISVANLPSGAYFMVCFQDGIKIATTQFIKN